MLISYLCVCVDPKGSGHQLYLPLGFLSSLGTTPGPSQLKKKHILFPKLTSVSLDWPLHFFEKKMARLMGFPKKYVKLSPFHPSNQLPSAAKQTLGGVWPLLPLASQDARPHQSYMLGNRKPNLYHIHIYVSIHVTTDMIYHVLCIYIYNVYICIYIYICSAKIL